MKLSQERLSEVYHGLGEGKRYCFIRNGRGYGFFCLTEDTYRNEKLIAYNCAGSSAVKYTPKWLGILLEDIFFDYDDVSEAVWSDYHIAYIPTEKGYRGFDCSRKHPNVYGL